MAKRFEAAPLEAMREVMDSMRQAVAHTLEQVMDAEVALFLGQPAETDDKRNGYRVRTFGLKGLGALQVRVPRDRAGRFESRVMPASRRYDAALEKDLALLNLAGLSTRMLSHVGGQSRGRYHSGLQTRGPPSGISMQ
jgi:transposase-like protein